MSDEGGSGGNNDDGSNDPASPRARPQQQAAPQEMAMPSLYFEMLRNDKYMMNSFKSEKCLIQPLYPHAASVCPFFHAGKTRRRNPFKFKYSPKLCKNIGDCEFDLVCDNAHNIFEYCLHPKIFSRSKCIDGLNCKSYPCAFPHGDLAELVAAVKPPLHPSPRRTPPRQRMPRMPYRPSPLQLPESSSSGVQEGGSDGASASGSKAEEDESQH